MNTMVLTLPARRPLQPRPIIVAPDKRRRVDWIERLAAWADRQPYHRRLGSWTRV